MPGVNVIGSCSESKNPRVSIRGVRADASIVRHDILTETWAPNPALDPPFEGTTQTRKVDFEATGTGESSRVDYTPGLTEFDLESNQFLMIGGCCCPCRWNIYPEYLWGAGDMQVEGTNTLIVDEDDPVVIAVYTSNDPNPYLGYASTGMCSHRSQVPGFPLMGITVIGAYGYRDSSSFSAPGDTWDQTVTIEGAERADPSELPDSVPGGLVVPFDNCNGGTYTFTLTIESNGYSASHDDELDTDFTRTYTSKIVITWTISIGADNGGPAAGEDEGGSLTTGSLQTGTLQTGGLSTGSLKLGTTSSGHLQSGGLQIGSTGSGHLSTGGLQTSSL